jgi:hypothetical protein
MKRVLLLLLLIPTLFLVAPPAMAQTDVLLVDFSGFDYEFPDAVPGEFGGIDDYYNMFGFIQQVNPTYLTIDPSTNEYTIEFWHLWSAGYFDFGNFRFISYTTGVVGLYEDPLVGGTPGTFGTNPPNATAPSSFLDGTLILGGDVENFGITLNLSDGTGNFTGDVHFNAGTQLGSIPPEAGVRVYTFAGLTSGPLAQVPEGYIHQVTGEIKIEEVVQVNTTSWGRMKALYR